MPSTAFDAENNTSDKFVEKNVTITGEGRTKCFKSGELALELKVRTKAIMCSLQGYRLREDGLYIAAGGASKTLVYLH